MKSSVSLAVATITIALLAGCGPYVPDPTKPGNEIVIPNKLEIVPGNTILEPDQATLFTVKQSSGAALGQAVTWASSNPGVAEVASSGLVSAKSAGKTTISAKVGTLEAKYDLSVTLTLRVGVKPNGDAPLTVFVSNADGSVRDSKTINPGEAAQTFEFKNVPGDALVTSAYQLAKTDFDCATGAPSTKNIYRLSSYPAAYVNGRTFYTGNDTDLSRLTATLIKPSFGASFAFGAGPQFFSATRTYDTVAADNCGATAAAASNSVKINAMLAQSEIGSNGFFSPLFYALDSAKNPTTYKAFKDLSIPRSVAERELTVGANDWQTDLRTLNITINNFVGTKSSDGSRSLTSWDCSRIHGSRLGVRYDNPTDCTKPVFDPTRNTLTRTLKYPPNFFTTLGYEIGFGARDFTDPLQPYWYVKNQKREMASLPGNLTLDPNADFLRPTGGLTLNAVNTNQPSFSWNNPSNFDSTANKRYTNVVVRTYGGNFDYEWIFRQLPTDQTALKVPALPSNLSGFAPKEGAGGRTYYAGTDVIEEFSNDAGLRSAYTSIDFSKGFTAQSRSGQNQASQTPEGIERNDQYAIKFK